jgi:DNA-binding response OmpR family regulator
MRCLSVRILMVENHETFAATITGEFLQELHVVRTGSVLEALDLFRTAQFDVALVDFDLDDVKGDIFIRRVREMRSAFPIVAISARDDGRRPCDR